MHKSTKSNIQDRKRRMLDWIFHEGVFVPMTKLDKLIAKGKMIIICIV